MSIIVNGLVFCLAFLAIDAAVLAVWKPFPSDRARRLRICSAVADELAERRDAGWPLDAQQLARFHVITARAMTRRMDPVNEADTTEIIGRIHDADDDRLINIYEWSYSGQLATA